MIRASAETCYECLRGENKQKLEVLSFEKAWDKIEKDIANLVNTWTSLLASEKTMDKMFSTILSSLFIVLMMEQLVSLEIIVGETFIPTVLMI